MQDINFDLLSHFELQAGSHKAAEDGLCIMEAVAWLEGEPHSDTPKCASKVVSWLAMVINDHLPHAERQKLVPYIPRLVGTASPEHERERARIVLWNGATRTMAEYFGACGCGATSAVGTMLRTLAENGMHRQGAWYDLAELYRLIRTQLDDALPGFRMGLDCYGQLRHDLAQTELTAVAVHLNMPGELGEGDVDAWQSLGAFGARLVAYGMCGKPGESAPGRRSSFRLQGASIALKTLNQVIEAGPHGRPFAKPVPQRLKEYRELIDTHG